jgi:ribosomal-protein-alanine N-acetyltransferase
LETQSLEGARNAIRYSHNAWKKKVELRFGVRLKAEVSEAPVLIGMCQLFDFANQHKAELGYWLGAAYHNQGIMTEAVRAVVAYAFGAMRMGRIYALTSTGNLPSIAMLQKVGFVKEGVLRRDSIRDGVWDDSAIFALLKDDFAIG